MVASSAWGPGSATYTWPQLWVERGLPHSHPFRVSAALSDMCERLVWVPTLRPSEGEAKAQNGC